MRLKNYTDIDSDLIRDLIRAVRPAGISQSEVDHQHAQHIIISRTALFFEQFYLDFVAPFRPCGTLNRTALKVKRCIR